MPGVNEDVVVVGSVNMDIVVEVPRLPTLGETLIAHSVQVLPGGKGGNQAVAARRLGAHVSLVARVGGDAYGQDLLTSLHNEGVDVAHVVSDPEDQTGTAIVTVDERGRNTIVVFPGANGRVTVDDISGSEEAVEDVQVLLVQLEIPIDAAEHAIRLAKRHGANVVLCPAPARQLTDDMLRHADVLVANQTEAARLSHTDVQDLDGALLAAQRLRTMGPKAAVVTLGEEGAILSLEGTTHHVAGMAVEAVDTAGAGDAFAGALAVALARGAGITECLRWANAAGALAATGLGAQSSLPTRAEVMHMLARARVVPVHGRAWVDDR